MMKLLYENTAPVFCVIGDPIAHSLSPLLQNTMLQELKEKGVYLAFPVKGGEVERFVEAAKTLSIRGFNLTMPHKEDILPYLSSMTTEAQTAKSVNSVRIVEGRLEGHSTDGIGFARSLLDHGITMEGKVITILGAGGAAKSIAMTALSSGAAAIHVLNRTLSRAEALCQDHETMTAHPLSDSALVLAETDILVNTLPLGMEGVSGSFPVELAPLKEDAFCADCIYAPALTPFMIAAKQQGHKAINGIGMLVYQAVYALEFFLHRDFSPETVTHLGKTLLTTANISPEGTS